MRKKRKLNKGNNTKFAIIFVGIVISIILISLIFKFFIILSQSQFDSSRRFTMTVSNKYKTKVLSISPISRSMSVLELDKITNTPINQFLPIPIDGFIKGESFDIDQKADSLFPKMILGYKKLNTNLTIVDLIRLFIAIRNLSESEVNERTISKDLNYKDIDSLARRLFNDELIEREGKKIEIVNSTNVSGLGNRLARLVTNMGGDVIIVATGDSYRKWSEITYIDAKNYTVERLSKILGFNATKAKDKTIADITITIGQDSLESHSF